jgi:predicted dehydrogenase
MEDIAYIFVYFSNNLVAHFHVNWLSPVKIRKTMIGGEKKMLVWNDLVADEKIRVYDKGVQITSGEGIRNLLVSYRTGDMWAPQVEQMEALHVELGYFAECIQTNQTPINDGHAGLRVVRMLEAAEASIRKRGELVRL